MKTLPKKEISDGLEKRIREALAEPPELVTLDEFTQNLQAIADGG